MLQPARWAFSVVPSAGSATDVIKRRKSEIALALDRSRLRTRFRRRQQNVPPRLAAVQGSRYAELGGPSPSSMAPANELSAAMSDVTRILSAIEQGDPQAS